MAIQRPSDNYNSDWMSRMQDGELEELEKRLSALYASAAQEATDKFNEFTEEFAEQEARMLDLLAVGKIDDDDFRIWRNNHILQSVRYQELIKSLTNMMVDTDVSAMAIVSGRLPFVIAESYNFVQALGWKAADDLGYSVGTFQIYNANAVQALIRDNPRLVPEVDLPIDQQWNMDHFNKAITQGILTGEPMQEIARNLKKVIGMDENSAIRNARTSFTYAENLGRDESYENLKKKGLPVRKKWSAVMDNRTRETHRLLNGTYADEETGLFGVGILAHPLRCPADKNGDPEEIYNCRCREGVVFPNDIVDHSNDDELYEQFLRENYPNDYEALLDRDYFNQHRTIRPQKPEGIKLGGLHKQPIEVTSGYTGSTNARRINDLLRQGFSTDDYQDIIARLDNAMETTVAPMTVYRELNLEDIISLLGIDRSKVTTVEDLQRVAVGKSFIERGFMSTYYEKTDNAYYGATFVIDAQAGTQALFTSNDLEREIILGRNQEWVVTSAELTGEDDWHRRWIFHITNKRK